ncbi:MAG: PaaI family thioesterase [Candidatus Promineifilaceae bacterium]|nr:PaaI family thioesterase [Candidatus Promineifilaceae bacterium]
MTRFTAQNPAYKERIVDSFRRQGYMTYLGARLVDVEAGKVIIELPIRPQLSQQHGFVHAGALASIADSACGYAALSLMPAGSQVLSVEFKVNMLSPAQGVRVLASGEVIKPGRTITVCRADVFSISAQGEEKLCANMQATMIRREGKRLSAVANL